MEKYKKMLGILESYAILNQLVDPIDTELKFDKVIDMDIIRLRSKFSLGKLDLEICHYRNGDVSKGMSAKFFIDREQYDTVCGRIFLEILESSLYEKEKTTTKTRNYNYSSGREVITERDATVTFHFDDIDEFIDLFQSIVLDYAGV